MNCHVEDDLIELNYMLNNLTNAFVKLVVALNSRYPVWGNTLNLSS